MPHALLLQNEAHTPLGRLRLSGHITDGTGVDTTPLRVYGAYAVVAILRGAGEWRDPDIRRAPVAAGDVLLVFPERAHWYGPPRGQTWDELYLTFDGPAFDLWRRAGVLDPARPVRRAPDGWSDALRALIDEAAGGGPTARRMRHVARLQGLLGDLLLTADDAAAETPPSDAGTPDDDPAVRAARALLDIDLGRACDLRAVAAEVGLGYENFRKRFQKAVGVSPAHYRTLRRIEAARELLRYAPHLTNRQVAEALGFADEYHFSRRFTQVTGATPRAFRRGATLEGGGTMKATEGGQRD